MKRTVQIKLPSLGDFSLDFELLTSSRESPTHSASVALVVPISFAPYFALQIFCLGLIARLTNPAPMDSAR